MTRRPIPGGYIEAPADVPVEQVELAAARFAQALRCSDPTAPCWAGTCSCEPEL